MIEKEVIKHSRFFSFVAQLVSFVAPPGLVSHSDLDDRAIEALKEFNEEGALQVLLQFKDSDLSHVQVCVRLSKCMAKIISALHF